MDNTENLLKLFFSLNFWLNFCTDFSTFRLFVERVLIPNTEFLHVEEFFSLIEHLCWYIKGKYPELSDEVNDYFIILKDCVEEEYRERLFDDSLFP